MGNLNQTLGSLIPLVFLIVFMYFFVIRPQGQKAKKHKELLAQLKKGDNVLTSGGLIGVVHRVEEGEIRLEIAKDVVVRVIKAQIISVLEKSHGQKSHPEVTIGHS